MLLLFGGLFASSLLSSPARGETADLPPATPAVAPAPAAAAGTGESTDTQPEPDAHLSPPDTSLQTYRLPLERLTERSLGRTSRRVRFDWRRTPLQLAATGGLPTELNNFDSLRAGGLARVPSGNWLFLLGFSHVWVNSNTSTERLSLTPYRQPGRPERFELDLGASFPVAEGVVTPFPGMLPAAQLVLHGQARFRYLIYPHGLAGLGLQDTLVALVSGSLSDDELANLESERPPGMQIDPGRYALLAGLGCDVYFQSGLFLGYELLVATPLLGFMTDSELPFGYELELSLGLAF